MQSCKITIGRLPKPHEAAPIQRWLTENLRNGYELMSILPTTDTKEVWYVFRFDAGGVDGGSFKEFSDFHLDS